MHASPQHARSRTLLALGLGLAAWGLLLFNTAASLDGLRLDQLRRARYWDEVVMAMGSVQQADFRVQLEPSYGTSNAKDILEEYGLRLRRLPNLGERMSFRIMDDVIEAGAAIRPWEFWRVVDVHLKPFLRNRGLPKPSPLEDPGRPALLAFGYRLLGGVAPWLLLWLPALLSLPVVVWTAVELFAVGRPMAAVIYVFLLSCSWFVVGVFHMTHSAVGFHVLGLLALVPLAVYATLGPSRSLGSLLVTLALASAVFTLCVLSRNGTLGLLPGYALAFWFAARRLLRSRGQTRAVPAALLALGLTAGFLTPYIVLRPAQQHPTWISVWWGLGDLDTTGRFYWSSTKAEKLLMRAGGHGVRRGSLANPFVGGGFELDVFARAEDWKRCAEALNAQQLGYEAVAQSLVLDAITSDPLWWLGILAERTWLTATQWKLWPWGPWGGVSMRKNNARQAGGIDHYYSYSPQADRFILGPWRLESPVPLLLAPSAGLLLLWLVRRRKDRRVAGNEGAGGNLRALVCVAAAAAAVPVLITTASGQETEAFIVVHLLGTAFCADALWSWWQTRRGRRRSTTPGAVSASGHS